MQEKEENSALLFLYACSWIKNNQFLDGFRLPLNDSWLAAHLKCSFLQITVCVYYDCKLQNVHRGNGLPAICSQYSHLCSFIAVFLIQLLVIINLVVMKAKCQKRFCLLAVTVAPKQSRYNTFKHTTFKFNVKETRCIKWKFLVKLSLSFPLIALWKKVKMSSSKCNDADAWCYMGGQFIKFWDIEFEFKKGFVKSMKHTLSVLFEISASHKLQMLLLVIVEDV